MRRRNYREARLLCVLQLSDRADTGQLLDAALLWVDGDGGEAVVLVPPYDLRFEVGNGEG